MVVNSINPFAGVIIIGHISPYLSCSFSNFSQALIYIPMQSNKLQMLWPRY